MGVNLERCSLADVKSVGWHCFHVGSAAAGWLGHLILRRTAASALGGSQQGSLLLGRHPLSVGWPSYCIPKAILTRLPALGHLQGQGLHKLLYAGVERGYWKKSFADKQSITSDPIIVTPYTASADLGEVSTGILLRCCKLGYANYLGGQI
jgi:hypothetical protein